MRGFSLLEILITVVLLSVGIAAVVNIFSNGIFVTADTESMDISVNIADAKLEELKDIPFENLSDIASQSYSAFPNYSAAVNVAEGADPMQIDVTVTRQLKGSQLVDTFSTLRTSSAYVPPGGEE